ncbi:hypothetical protein E2C01_026787 [Portunus trituberculatus]|uniref:Uncharacterized protein n=1 Tax=Portunus trituberculatus TaxID=210409 RepID=A0A5B7EJL1_PORTR|nr:hypothetical protein [Portunus trituberculatus]
MLGLTYEDFGREVTKIVFSRFSLKRDSDDDSVDVNTGFGLRVGFRSLLVEVVTEVVVARRRGLSVYSNIVRWSCGSGVTILVVTEGSGVLEP